MPTLVIRSVEDEVHSRLAALAAAHGWSMEDEVRSILGERVAAAPLLPAPIGFGDAIRALFKPLGGLELPEMPRELPREPIDFSRPEWDPKE